MTLQNKTLNLFTAKDTRGKRGQLQSYWRAEGEDNSLLEERTLKKAL